MVLATDMSCHFQQMKTMKSLLAHPDLMVDKVKALSLIVHCCDISHPAKRFDIHSKWTGFLMEEFFRQVSLTFAIFHLFLNLILCTFTPITFTVYPKQFSVFLLPPLFPSFTVQNINCSFPFHLTVTSFHTVSIFYFFDRKNV